MHRCICADSLVRYGQSGSATDNNYARKLLNARWGLSFFHSFRSILCVIFRWCSIRLAAHSMGICAKFWQRKACTESAHAWDKSMTAVVGLAAILCHTKITTIFLDPFGVRYGSGVSDDDAAAARFIHSRNQCNALHRMHKATNK